MKKVLRFWIWLFLFSLSPVTTSAQVQRFVPKQEALSIAQGQFRGQDVDYYILDDSTSSTWNIFVDAEPMKGWQHRCGSYNPGCLRPFKWCVRCFLFH